MNVRITSKTVSTFLGYGVYIMGPHLLGVLRFPQWEGKFTAA